jgi:hypothetical protein
MADWSLPTLSSLYTDFLAEVDARLNDSAQMFSGGPTNQPVGSVRYFRATNTFQEWDGENWVDKVLSIAGGGTGATTAAGIRTNLGLGTIAIQNANAVNITGGSLTGITGLAMIGDISFVADNASRIGTNVNRPSFVYIRSGLVIPVGVDKFATS